MAYVGSSNISHELLYVFYALAEVSNYLENRIDPIAIIINGD